jgi:hypothetical protein
MAQRDQLYLGEVRSNINFDETCTLRCVIEGEGNEERTVHYCPPMSSAGGEAGIIAIPAVGTRCIIAKISGGWYYQNSVLAAPKPAGVIEDSEGATIENSPPVPDTANVSPELARTGDPTDIMTIAGKGGNKLVFYNEGDENMHHRGVVLRSQLGKALILEDTRAVNEVRLKNEHGDHLVITSGPDRASETLGDRSSELETFLDQRYISQRGDITTSVEDGGEIVLVNKSIGTNANIVDENTRKQFGNVNIESDKRDINLFTRGDGETIIAGGTDEDPNTESSRIFIECLNEDGRNQLIQIDTRGSGTVRIVAPKIEVSAGVSGLDIYSASGINIVAGGNINMRSQSMNLQAKDSINADTTEDDGAIHLNSDESSSADTDIGFSNSYYGLSSLGLMSG